MIELDSRSKLLASNLGWLKGFAHIYEKLLVAATHVDEVPNDLPANIEVIELGGGSFPKRLYALWKLMRIVYSMQRETGSWHVFHHMIHYTALFPGIIFRVLGYPQALWYSHKAKPRLLNIASQIVDVVTSTAITSFPLYKEIEVIALGHGIDNSRFSAVETVHNERDYTSTISYLGRINRVKNLEKLLKEVAISKAESKFQISFIGPIQDSDYASELFGVAESEGILLNILEPIDYSKVPNMLNKFSYFFSGTEESIDKSALEAAMCGCIVVTENRNLLEAIGMDQYWSTITNGASSLRISEQLFYLERLSPNEKSLLRRRIAEHARQSADVNRVTQAIHDLLVATK